MGEGGWLVGTGGGPYFSKNKVFSGGSGLGCRLGRSWTVPTGHQDPLAPPRACLALVRHFILCFLESGLASPFWGARRSRVGRGFLPGDSHPLPPPAHIPFLRRGLRWRGRGRLFYTSHFKGGFHPPLKPPGGERKRGKIIYLFGDGGFWRTTPPAAEGGGRG